MSDYYSILRIPKNSTKIDIKKAYNELVKIYYPDKPTGNAVMFEKITKAFKTLMSESDRELYDKTLKESDHKALVSRFKKDIKNINIQISSLPDANAVSDEPITTNDFSNKLSDFELIRDQDDIESLNPNLFGEKFDQIKFNKMFESISNNYRSQEIIPFDMVNSAYGEMDNNFNEINADDSDFGSYFSNDISAKLNEVNVDDFDDFYTSEKPMNSNDISARLEEYQKFYPEKFSTSRK